MTHYAISILMHLIAGITFVSIVSYLNKNAIDDKILTGGYFSLGWLRFFSFISGGILLQDLNKVIEIVSVRNKINGDTSTFSLFGYSAFFIFLAIIFWFVIRLMARGMQRTMYPKLSLIGAIKDDNISFILAYSGILIMLSLVFRPLILELITNALPVDSVPFYH